MSLFAFLFTLDLGVVQAGQVYIAEEGHVYNPQWAPGGTWIAFELNRYGDAVDLYLARVNGGVASVPVKVVIPGATSSFSSRGSVVTGPVWHPEGHVIFEGSNAGGTQRLYFMSPGGQSAAELLPVSQIQGDLTWPALSPDGRSLAFVSDTTGNGDIYIWEQSDNQVRGTITSPWAEASPEFSPDASLLAFSRKNSGSEDLFLWRNGGDAETLRSGNGDQSRPVWVGDQVVYFTNERGEGHWDIAVTTVGGGDRRILARDIRLPMRANPAITPDQRSVAYTLSDPELADRLMVTTLASGTTVEIPTGLVACGEPDLVQLGDGRVFAAFTALPTASSDWRQLHVLDVTGKLP